MLDQVPDKTGLHVAATGLVAVDEPLWIPDVGPGHVSKGSAVCTVALLLVTSVSMSLHFVAECSAAQQQQRYEDVLLQDPAPAGDCCSRSFSCWALFDGHNGDTVARFLGSSLLPELESRLPAMPLPQEEPEQYVYADAVRRAVTAAFLSLSLRVSGLAGGAAAGCGSAAAVVVQTGHLLTVANTGSSKCVLDVGHCAIECSADHRLGNNEDEEERLSAAGAYVARLKFDLSGPAAPGQLGCGPLRLWPGGLHMSRAIGDGDCGQLVLPHPYIQQVWLPRRPSRLIMATGSVWDVFESWQKAAAALRSVSLQNAAGALLRRALKRKQHRADRGDMSVLVLDFCPESSSGSSFKSQTHLERIFQAYFRGQYAPVEQQLAMLEASCGWSTLQPPCRQSSAQDGYFDQGHCDRGFRADQQQQQQRVAADRRKVSSPGDAAISMSVAPLLVA
ncbi:hypothetical protein OEZ86_011006 [Tetradesmus obliquus]|nr:hypothetical protein OEZ86_011006 [Tetradesmus obliquus]